MLNARLLPPDVEGLGPNYPISIGDQQAASGMEVAMDECVRRKKVLSMFRRFESLHLTFSTSCRTK
jgi:hypothetical protein